MDKLTTAGLNGSAPVVFASNLLAIIVPKGNPAGITGVADLAKPDVKVVVCAPEVPCGKYASQVFDAAKITVTPVSQEQNVKGVVTKVISGEADAGIVYITDVMAASDKAEVVTIPNDINVVAKYPIASVKASTHADVDQAFIEFVLGPDGQQILAKYGFMVEEGVDHLPVVDAGVLVGICTRTDILRARITQQDQERGEAGWLTRRRAPL